MFLCDFQAQAKLNRSSFIRVVGIIFVEWVGLMQYVIWQDAKF